MIKMLSLRNGFSSCRQATIKFNNSYAFTPHRQFQTSSLMDELMRGLRDKVIASDIEDDRRFYLNAYTTIGNLMMDNTSLQEKTRAEQEKTRAEQEKTRAEEYRARLAEEQLSQARFELLQEKHKLHARGLMEEYERNLRINLSNSLSKSLTVMLNMNRKDLWSEALNDNNIYKSLLNIYPCCEKKRNIDEKKKILVQILSDVYSKFSDEIHNPVEVGLKNNIFIRKKNVTEEELNLLEFFAKELHIQYNIVE